MKERPVLMNGAMVRATLRDVDPKTQTRRVIKPQPLGYPWFWEGDDVDPDPQWFDSYCVGEEPCGAYSEEINKPMRCPFGQPGDRLYVRETWQAWQRTSYEHDEWQPIGVKDATASKQRAYAGGVRVDAIEYCADGKSAGPWTPSIHMPRWASRITLEVTGIKVERLQDISEEDARAEGVERSDITGMYHPTPFAGEVHAKLTARQAFESLWKAINGPDSWDANPWVWAITFKRIEAQR